MLVRVENRQQYAVARGGHVFPPLASVEVEVKGDRKLAEITACVYLKVTPVATLPVAESQTGALDYASMSKAELLAIAETAGIEVKKSWTNAQLAEAIGDVEADEDEPADESADDTDDETSE